MAVVRTLQKFFLLICEYTVCKGLFDEITITRLPVGHTHEVETTELHDDAENILKDEVG